MTVTKTCVAAWDEFSGGPQLRVRRVLTLEAACQQHARALLLEVHSPAADFAAQLKRVLTPFRGGAVRLQLRVRQEGATIDLELGSTWRLRGDPTLPELLRSLPGVTSAELRFGREAPAESVAA